MKTLKRTIPLLMLTVASCIFAQESAKDPVIENTAAARKHIADASKEYNVAVRHILNSDTLLRDNINRANVIASRFAELESRLDGGVANLNDYKNNLRMLRENLKQGTIAIDYAKQTINFANESFPIGDKRFDFANELYKEGFALVAKNPGKNYEDKRYFDSVWNDYVNRKNSFVANQKQIAQVLLKLNIASPRMAGADTTLKIVEDFISKTEKNFEGDKKTLEDIKKSVEELYDASMKSYAELTSQMNSLGEARNKFTKENFTLSVFIMNELPKNEKYYKTIFTPDTLYLSAANNYYAARTIAEPSGLGGEQISYTQNVMLPKLAVFGTSASLAKDERSRSLAKRKTVSQVAEFDSPVSIKGSMLGDTVNISKPENLREEISAICLQITNLSAEIAQTNALLSEILSESAGALNAVDASESGSASLLGMVTSTYSLSQTLNPEIQVFKSNFSVSTEQSKVASAEFAKLCGFIDTAIKNSAKSSEDSAKSLLKAKDALVK